MARKGIQESTIKKLFALSGNECSFPGCYQPMVENDQVFGQICHIEAANCAGQRYNSNQTDDERREFDNLILLCAIHHIETNNESKYTVSKLKKMKSDHENRFINNKFEIDDNVIHKIYIDYVDQYNINTGSGIQTITRSGDIHIGMNFTEVKEVFEILFVKNFPRIQEEAQRAAKERVNLFLEEFFIQVNDRNASLDINAFSDPDIQFVLTKAIEASARRDNNELRSILASLLIARIVNNDGDFYSLVLSESIIAASRLTKDQLMIMAISFTLTAYLYLQEINSWSELNIYINKYVEPFFGPHINKANVFYIEYTGCGGIEFATFSTSFYSHLSGGFPDIFKLPIEKRILEELNLDNKWFKEIFKVYDNDHFIFAVDFIPTDLYDIVIESDTRITLYDILNNMHKEYVMGDIYTNNKMNPGTQKILAEMDHGDYIISSWEEKGLTGLRLNAVGYVIAATYCSQVLGENIDIRAILSI